eukprot:TRINITY_DN177_c1_g1_i1.p1 TRINITY_DN177_c1_g1~~TRINITY_DN177_c1_g1_i1.p1  ORF type:complete len:302 (-),score=47.71 TRINITY_DN177_c1_g1_i1:457-1362(-)
MLGTLHQATRLSNGRDRCLIQPTSLASLLKEKSAVRVFDASWGMDRASRDYQKEHESQRIPSSAYFDIDVIKDKSSPLPHMLPTSQEFESAMNQLGVTNDDEIVVYDGIGSLLASARCWWTFKVFGHDRVRILDGGLQRWKEEGYPTESGPIQQFTPTVGYKAHFQHRLVQGFPDMLKLSQEKAQIVDARSKERFQGTAPEPRQGLRSGHIPNSVSIPYSEVINTSHGKTGYLSLKDDHELAEIFRSKGIDVHKPVAATCGSGVTASVLALAIHMLGGEDYSVYDGSWSEWGQPEMGPVEK